MEIEEYAKKGLSALNNSIHILLLEVLKNENIKKVHNTKVTPGCLLGDNFIGLIHRVFFDVTTCDGQFHVFSVIIKCMPANKTRCKVFDIDLNFQSEINFYEYVLPGLQSGTNITLAIPRFFGTLCNGSDDAIILEDLKSTGFQMRKRQLGLDLPHIILIVQELGKLHALSMAQRIRDPENFHKTCNYVKDIFYSPDGTASFRTSLPDVYKDALRIILKHYKNDHDNHYVKAMKKLAEAGFNFILSIVKGAPDEEKVITHGDCWINNLQFRYNDNATPIDVRFLDFQLHRISSPAMDLTYVLFTSMRYETMSLHYDEILDVYHSSLDKYLTQLGHSTSLLFPRSRLEAEMARCAPYGLTMAVIVVPAVYCPPESAPDLNAVTGDTLDSFTEEYVKLLNADTKDASDQLLALLQYCVDRGFLDNIM